ncbi:histone acetyltransferase KAT6A-like [Tachypleus tridentatus]|uniref:histone acetyltransferase KAT6A-like n=1 Tax=Tachypleus tridentatus TaxID=6853 RepID=UPI003FCF1407
MSGFKYKDLILNAIDQLHERKARPDSERICHILERKNGVNSQTIKTELQKLVDARIVVKVEYKGNVSYRNAAKWARNNRIFMNGHMLYWDGVRKAVAEAFHEITACRENFTNLSVSREEIESYLSNNKTCMFSKLSSKGLDIFLKSEVDSGRIKKLPSGNFLLNQIKENGEVKSRFRPAKSGTESLNAPLQEERKNNSKKRKMENLNASHIKQTVSLSRRGRRKKFKKNPGPDFLPWSEFEKTDDLCDFCQQTASTNRLGKPEELLVCKDCSAKAHPSCMQYGEKLTVKCREYPWQCIDCKRCVFCDQSDDDGDSMLFCDGCDKGYHMVCHVPALTEKPGGLWYCNKCNDEKESEVEKVSTSSGNYRKEDVYFETSTTSFITPTRSELDPTVGLPTPCSSPIPEDKQHPYMLGSLNKRTLSQYPEIVPDAKDWTIDDVEGFFSYVGFPEQASAFKEQEIDGKSLLLMKRNDVLTGLSIRLGPALKIYNHVKRLQTGLPNGHLL